MKAPKLGTRFVFMTYRTPRICCVVTCIKDQTSVLVLSMFGLLFPSVCLGIGVANCLPCCLQVFVLVLSTDCFCALSVCADGVEFLTWCSCAFDLMLSPVSLLVYSSVCLGVVEFWYCCFRVSVLMLSSVCFLSVVSLAFRFCECIHVVFLLLLSSRVE